MTTSLVFYGVLGIVSTALAFRFNRNLFARERTGGVSLLEGIYYFVGVAALCLGWYFNVRYVHTYHHASYINYIKMLFTNWAADWPPRTTPSSISSCCRCGRSPMDGGEAYESRGSSSS